MASEHDVEITTGAGGFEKSLVFPVHFGTAAGERVWRDFPLYGRARSGMREGPTNWLDCTEEHPTGMPPC